VTLKKQKALGDEARLRVVTKTPGIVAREMETPQKQIVPMMLLLRKVSMRAHQIPRLETMKVLLLLLRSLIQPMELTSRRGVSSKLKSRRGMRTWPKLQRRRGRVARRKYRAACRHARRGGQAKQILLLGKLPALELRLA
jgi:hypothetical protein